MNRIPFGYTTGIAAASYAMVRLLDILHGPPPPLPWGFYFIAIVAGLAFAFWRAEHV